MRFFLTVLGLSSGPGSANQREISGWLETRPPGTDWELRPGYRIWVEGTCIPTQIPP